MSRTRKLITDITVIGAGLFMVFAIWNTGLGLDGRTDKEKVEERFEKLYPESEKIHGPHIYCDGLIQHIVYIDYENNEIKEKMVLENGKSVKCERSNSKWRNISYDRSFSVYVYYSFSMGY